jgi:hypothetical protein
VNPADLLTDARRRHLAFWERQEVDRPLLLIQRRAPGRDAEDDALAGLKQRDLQRFGSDPGLLVRRARQELRRTLRLGDDLPLLRPPLGPSMLAAFLGARVETAPDTVWFHPTVGDLAELAEAVFDPANPWWRITEECQRLLATEPEGVPVVPDLGSLGDNLAALIGADRLMLEMVERPELVEAVLARMLAVAQECYRRLFAIAQAPGRGTANWLGLWSPAKTGILQNDLSIMLSTPMYRRFFGPEFAALGAYFDYSIFHVDGTRAQRHIPGFIAGIPGLRGCQLGSDPGTRAMQILPVLRQLQAAGKNIFTYVFPDEIEELFSQLSPVGVCVITPAASEAEAGSLRERFVRACAGDRTLAVTSSRVG